MNHHQKQIQPQKLHRLLLQLTLLFDQHLLELLYLAYYLFGLVIYLTDPFLFVLFDLCGLSFNHPRKAHKRQRHNRRGNQGDPRAAERPGHVGPFQVFPDAAHDADCQGKAQPAAETGHYRLQEPVAP